MLCTCGSSNYHCYMDKQMKTTLKHYIFFFFSQTSEGKLGELEHFIGFMSTKHTSACDFQSWP